MVAYRRGYLAELKACDVLRQEGYVAVRVAASRGPFDVVGVGPAGVRLVQVKVVGGKEKVGAALRQGLREIGRLPALPGVRREVWVWLRRKGFVAKAEGHGGEAVS